jgi:hypothetical protein
VPGELDADKTSKAIPITIPMRARNASKAYMLVLGGHPLTLRARPVLNPPLVHNNDLIFIKVFSYDLGKYLPL